MLFPIDKIVFVAAGILIIKEPDWLLYRLITTKNLMKSPASFKSWNGGVFL